jgi:hypothetical protein
MLTALTAGAASAQIVFDGNLLFNNGSSGTLAGQFQTVAGFASGSCTPGLNSTAAEIGTVQYTNNSLADPLLGAAIYQTNVVPNWRPAAGSPAFGGNPGHGKALVLPANGFFSSACYVGALGPEPEGDWTQGWTYYDSTGAGRQDLHLPGMPDPRPLATYDNRNLYSSQTWSADSNYLIRGQLRVKAQATLTIPAGTVVFQERASVGTLIVERGARLVANGTRDAVIIVTTDAAPGSMTRGSIGGIVIHGRATTNAANSCAGDSAASEGGLVGFYGGNDDDDDSGVLRYVRVEYAGREISPNNELNSFTWNAVGRGTVLEYLQAHRGADDSFEFFGGAGNVRYFVGTDNTDDGLDWQMGWHGNAQFGVLRISAEIGPPPAGGGTAQNGDKGIEADNKENDEDNVTCSGRSNPIVANLTIVGDRRSGIDFPGSASAVHLRRGTGGQVLNSICTNFKSSGLRLESATTAAAHCGGTPVAPALLCGGTVSVPVAEGRVFVARGAPNPFRGVVALRFALPHAGRVDAEIYSADGRLVKTLAAGELPAGEHALTWTVDRVMPSGVYFYKVLVDGAQATGKLVRVD